MTSRRLRRCHAAGVGGGRRGGSRLGGGCDPLSARWVPGDVLTPGWSLNRKLLFRACGVGLAALFLQKNPHPFIAPSGF